MAYYYNYNNSGNRGGFLSNVPKVTKNLLYINVIVFLATFISEQVMHSDIMTRAFALFYPASHFFKWWQPFTYMFMHGGFWHILFNMYTLVMFGCVVERMIGEKKFLAFYIICGLGAAAAQIGTQAMQAASYANGIELGAQAAIRNYGILLNSPTVGASGAIYGILIAFAMLFPESKMTLIFPLITLSAKWMVVVFAAIELLTGASGAVTGVAHFAHLGGMLIGWLLIMFWRKRGVLFDKDKWY